MSVCVRACVMLKCSLHLMRTSSEHRYGGACLYVSMCVYECVRARMCDVEMFFAPDEDVVRAQVGRGVWM